VLDDQGYFRQFNQSLYFARILTEQLSLLESNPKHENGFQRQQQECYFEAAVQSLSKALCFLACTAMTPEQARELLREPGGILKSLKSSIDHHPSAALVLLQTRLEEIPSTNDDVPLGLLLDRFNQVWGRSAASFSSSSPDLISSTQSSLKSVDCQSWHQQIARLGEALVDMLAES
jgi:hypothetical protein